MKLPELPDKLICQECRNDNPKDFEKAYYIPEGGRLPEGWVVICKPCTQAIEATIGSWRK